MRLGSINFVALQEAKGAVDLVERDANTGRYRIIVVFVGLIVGFFRYLS